MVRLLRRLAAEPTHHRRQVEDVTLVIATVAQERIAHRRHGLERVDRFGVRADRGVVETEDRQSTSTRPTVRRTALLVEAVAVDTVGPACIG